MPDPSVEHGSGDPSGDSGQSAARAADPDRATGRTRPPRGGPLVGRAADLESLHGLLADGRDLITLTGPGGVGKTRLAAHIFADVNAGRHPRFTEGAAFIRLDAVADPALVLPTIAREFGLKEAAERSPLDVLADGLRDRAVVLILDNVEHVIEAAPAVSELLQACPGLAVVATSRRHLNLTGETVYRVDPLPVPSMTDLQTPDRRETRERIEAIDAVRLLVERAAARDRRFAPTDATAADLLEICRRVDGLPLAIEVVAPRLAVLGAKPLLTELRHRIRPLPAGPDDAPPRHRTVHDAVAWSYDLLDPPTQAIFRRIGIFAGGATFDAIQSIAAEPVADAVARLCDDNLLRVDTGPNGEGRYAMLATTQEFAAAQLAGAGEEADARQAHAAYFARLAQWAETGLGGPDHAVWGATLDAELANLRLALAWTLDGPSPDLDTGLRLASALWTYWDRRGHRQEALQWLRRAALVSSGVQSNTRATVLRRLGNVLGDTNTHDARLHYQQALDLTRVLGDQDLIAGLLRNVGRVLSDQGEYESASSLLREAEAICIRLQDALGLARTLAHSSHVSRESEQQADADAAAQRLLALLGALDDFELRIWTYLELGRNALARGDLPAAGTWLGRGLELADDLAEREWVAYATLERAAVRFRQGEIGTALADLTLAFHTLRDTGSDFGTVLCLEHFASIAAVSGQADRALLLWGSIDAWRTRTGYVVPAFDRRRRAAERAAAEGLVQRGPAPLLAAVPALDLEHACRIALHVTAAHIQPVTLRLTGAPPTAPSPSPLSRRETQVLALVAESLSNQEIAERMFISASTAMKHIEHIFEKLGVNRRMEAVRVGRQSGWLPHEP